MQFGRLLSFALGIVGGSLLQLWVLLIILHANHHPIGVKEVLGSGGLFFFASSLSVGSALNLFDSRPITIGKLDFNMTFLICGGVLLLTVGYYAAVLSGGGLAIAKPFGDYFLMQIGCAFAAVGYWFFAGLRTGLFIKKDNFNA